MPLRAAGRARGDPFPGARFSLPVAGAARPSPRRRLIVALAPPALASLATDPLYSLFDTAFVAHLGTTELGAVAVGSAACNASF